MSAIVLSPNTNNYRRVARDWYGLTDAQIQGVDIHHNPPVSEGGRNIPEHLYIYHPTLHAAVHNLQNKGVWGSMSSGNRTGKRGRPPKKTGPTQRDIQCITLRNEGFTRTEICDRLGLSLDQVKRSIREAMKYGYENLGKPGPQPGLPQRGGNPQGKNQYTTLH